MKDFLIKLDKKFFINVRASVLLCFALYVEFNGRSLSVSLLAAFILFVLQTKTAIALGALLLLFVIFFYKDKASRNTSQI